METKHSSEEYGEIENLIPYQVPQLRKILKEKYNIIVPSHCDDFIARCIRMKDGNLENAIKLVKVFHTATGEFPSWDATFKPSHDIDDYNAGKLMIISQKDVEGRIVYMGRVGMWEPDKTTFDQGMLQTLMPLQYIMAISKDAQRRGVVTIWDFSGFSMKHVWSVDKWKFPYLIRIIQNGFAGRIKEFHSINHPRIFSILYSTAIKPFLKEKIKERVIFHDKVESLHAHVNKNGLPKFAGGNKEIDECMDWNLMKDFYGQDQYFIDMINDRFPRY